MEAKRITEKAYKLIEDCILNNGNLSKEQILKIIAFDIRNIIREEAKKIVNDTNTSEEKYTLHNVSECKHENIVAEFMGGGFLHKCADCGKILYGL